MRSESVTSHLDGTNPWDQHMERFQEMWRSPTPAPSETKIKSSIKRISRGKIKDLAQTIINSRPPFTPVLDIGITIVLFMIFHPFNQSDKIR